MSSQTTVVDGKLSKGEIFDVLRNQRRRFVLQYLKRVGEPVELGELATQVAAWEYRTPCDEVTSEQRKRVYTTLQQTHLPRMAEANIIEYDSDDGLIQPTTRTKDLSIYLEIVPGSELPWREYYLSLGAVSCALCAAVWGNVYPFTVLPDVAWAMLISVSFTVSAAIHIYYEQNMRLGDLEIPPELELE
ncbi:DUF7344 domain-containing protein [Haloarchaeobius amylolyticus]|uniref:DUF7344 domain-containing protein n=1 Tax=Haloarchaeobius amylolyticus TaxID=1198296 RepID=UPI00226F4EC0|nr:hypothetical protein [Haloarchaeobius amylolyticus]